MHLKLLLCLIVHQNIIQIDDNDVINHITKYVINDILNVAGALVRPKGSTVNSF